MLVADSSAPARDITEGARADEAGNFLRHAGALSLSKLADGLIDPKLVLSWLMGALGAPAVLLGFLVPVREAGSLLPQLFIAARVRALGRRKWAWAGASLAQGLAALAILWAGLTLSGTAAGAVILGALAVLALSRSVASVSHKDVLGKTVDRARRGTVTGLAGSIAATGVVGFALLLMSGQVARFELVLGAIGLAGVFWLGSAFIFATIREEDVPGTAQGGAGLSQLALLWRDPVLGRFVAARVLLLPTALAPPYLVLLASQAGDGRFGALGALVLASSLAGMVSSFVWGRLADRSSRLVLAIAGAVASVFLALAVALDAVGVMGTAWAAPGVLFGLMIAYQGVRLGRTTYLVDMAPGGDRAAYTAVANTTVGVALLAAGGFGAVAAATGVAATLGMFAGLAGLGAALALTLRET
ncbi:MAG: MFS transporter [Rhodobacteraceae bacterium]|nr:MFS transporter [Paracoccaceae bacterium]